MKITDKSILYVLQLSGKHYQNSTYFLKKLYGDWGPDHGPTEDIERAIKFHSQSEAVEYAKSCGWSYNGEGLTPLRIKVTTTIEY